MSGFDELEIVAKLLSVGGISAVLDYRFRPLAWILAAQVGDTVLGDDHLHGMLGMICVADHWHHRGNLAALLSGRAAED